jgi:hypothetical protein
MVRQRTGSTVASVAMQTQPADSAQSTVARRTASVRYMSGAEMVARCY